MKKIFCITYFFAAAIFFPQVSFANNDPVGYLDYAGCDSISGWTCDADDYAKPLDVHFYYDGEAGVGEWAGSTVANIARETAVANLCGGNAAHGFAMPTPDFLKDGQSHDIYGYAINTPAGSNPLLSNGQKKLQCGSKNDPFGYLDEVTNYYVNGWICDGDDFAKPLKVYFYDGPIENQKNIGSAIANGEREPQVGQYCDGTSAHGYYWKIPASLNDGQSHKIYVYAENLPLTNKFFIGAKDMKYMNLGCQSECSAAGAQCFDKKSYQNCRDTDGDGCFELSSVNNCAAGSVCEKGQCVLPSATEKYLDLTASAVADKFYFEKRMYFFPLPANTGNINLLGFTGSISFSAKNPYFDDMALNVVGFVPGPCPQNQTYPDWPPMNAAHPVRSNFVSYIIKTFPSGVVRLPVDFRFDKKIPFNSQNQCVYLLIDGGMAYTNAEMESHISLIYEDASDPADSNPPVMMGLDHEYIFPPANRNNQATMFVNKNIASGGYRLTGVNGDISVAAYTDTDSDWTAYADGYIYKNCSGLTNGYQGGQRATAVIKDYYAQIPADAIKIYSAQFNGHGYTAAHASINKYFSDVNMENGNCFVGLAKFVSAGGGAANTEIQLHAQFQKIICASGQVSGCKVCLNDGTGWQNDNSKCAANQTCQNGSCVNKSVCVAKTCASLGNYQCGDWSDGCGAMINCGACASGKTCSNGQCVSNCTSHAAKKCDGDDLYWYNSCNTKEGLAQNCNAESKICRDGACVLSGGGGGGGSIEPQNPQQKLTREEILQKIAEVKKLLIQLISELIVELQKQLAALPKSN